MYLHKHLHKFCQRELSFIHLYLIILFYFCVLSVTLPCVFIHIVMSVEHAFLCSVQVRRTDKINTEAAYHGIDEYMLHVEEWYQKHGMTHHVERKRVFIATDDPTVIKEARTKLVSIWDRLY